MKEGIEKPARGKKKIVRSLEDLGSHFKADEHIPVRAHSLSSGAVGEAEYAPESGPDPRIERIEEVVQRFFDTAEARGDLEATYAELFRSIPEEDRESFKTRLVEAADERDKDLTLPPDPAPVAEAHPQAAEAAEIPEWRMLLKQNPRGDGVISGRKFWRAQDGSVFIDTGRSVPSTVVSGGTIRIKNKETGAIERFRWDTDAGTFSAALPDMVQPMTVDEKKRRRDKDSNEPYTAEGLGHARAEIRKLMRVRDLPAEAKAQFQAGVERMQTRQDGRDLRALLRSFPFARARTVDNTPYSREELKAAQEKLKSRLNSVKIDAERFVKLGERIVGATEAKEIRELSRELAALESARVEVREAKQETPPQEPAATVEIPANASIPNQAELEGLLSRLAARSAQSQEPSAPAIAPDAPRAAASGNVELRAAIARAQGSAKEAPLDLSRFQLVANSDLYTGGPNTEPHYYEHPDRPGQRFSLEEVSRMRQQGSLATEKVVRAPEEVVMPPVTRQVTETVTRDFSTRRPEFEGLRPASLREILASAEGERSMGDLLATLDVRGGDIMRRMNTGETLSLEEVKFIDYARHEYARRMQMVEAVRGRLLTSDLDYVAQHDDALRAVFGLNGTERTTELFKRALPQLAMLRPEAIERLYHATANLEQLRDTSEVTAWEQEINDICREAGVPLEKYNAIFNKRTQKQIEEKYRVGMSTAQRILHDFETHPKKRVKALVSRAERARERMSTPGEVRQVGVELKALATMLRYTTIDNPELWHIMQQEAVRNTALARPSDAGPHTYAEAQREGAKAPQTAEALVTEATKRYKDAHGKEWDRATVEERTKYMDAVRHQEHVLASRKSGGGWFARGLTSLFLWLFDQKATEAVRRPAHA